MAEQKTELNIFNYLNYRDFLRDFYDMKKKGPRGYSFRAFSMAAGFTSPNILKLIIENKRNISVQAAQSIAKACLLSGNKEKFFLGLVAMNQAKNDAEKNIYYEELKQLIPFSLRRELNEDTMRYLSNWLLPVIREMINLNEFREDPYWIHRRLNGTVSPNDINQALHFLFKEGFIVREKNRYVAKDKMVLSTDEVSSLAVRNYHRQMIRQAEEMLEKIPMAQREFGALTFVLPESSMEELKEKLKTFRRSLHEWAVLEQEKKMGEIIVQLNYQMYPHTKKVSS